MPPPCLLIAVLGDLGRSPRILNHAFAAAESGFDVVLAGYAGTPVDAAVGGHPRVRIRPVRTLARGPEGSSRLLFLGRAALRFGVAGADLLRILLTEPRAAIILVQSPPSIGAAVAQLAASLRRIPLVVDWHNFGDALLALRPDASPWLVRSLRLFERVLARRASANLCVSEQMRSRLPAPAAVLYDRPRSIAATIPISGRHAGAAPLLDRLGIEHPSTRALAVCPTSWTSDEDIDVLLAALCQLPGGLLTVLITGEGPLRAAYSGRLPAGVHSVFLDPAEYRYLLGVAHLGISVHRSASGADLPMKIVDFFAARTPVCALDYGPCLDEQLPPQAGTAVRFRSASELALLLRRLLDGFPHTHEALDAMQRSIERRETETWDIAWRRTALPLLRRLTGVACG